MKLKKNTGKHFYVSWVVIDFCNNGFIPKGYALVDYRLSSIVELNVLLLNLVLIFFYCC